MTRMVRIIDAIAVAALIGAATLRVWPTAARVSPTEITIPSDGVVENGPVDMPDATAASASPASQIVSSNLFSASRRAPAVAFVPPGMEGSTVDMNAPGTLPATDPADEASAFDGLQLFGIVTQDGERRALLQLPGSDVTPRLMRVGERRAGHRVVSIAAQSVVIASPAGSRTLRLAPRTPPDSLENLP